MIEQTELSPVSHTMLMTLAARASASESAPDTDFRDPWGEAIVRSLPWDLSSYRNDLDLVRHVALRARLIDDLAVGVFLNDPGTVGVSLGCGLCSRGRRVSERLK
jgi:O-methyltransferase involved in polyketide biosynthesis